MSLDKPEEDKRRLFLVLADDTPDALLRVLGVANVQQTRLRSLTAEPDGAGLAIRMEVDDQGDDRAQFLAARLGRRPVGAQRRIWLAIGVCPFAGRLPI